MAIKLSTEQRAAIDLIEGTNEHVFLTGKAGSGKSAVIKHLKKKSRKRIVFAASTGIAALNIEGMTLHRLAGLGTALPADLGIDMPKVASKRQYLKGIDTIVIDEISMVSSDLLDAVDRNLRYITGKRREPFGGIQIVGVGDCWQLPPVTTDVTARWLRQNGYASEWFFDALIWKETDLSIVELQQVFRQQDDRFKDLLNGVRDGSITNEDIRVLNALGARQGRTDHALLLGSTNRIVDDRNQKNLKALRGRTHVYTARVNTGFGRNEPAERRLELKVGAHVIMLNNDQMDRWANGSRGEIEQCGPESVTVRFWDTDDVHEVTRNAWVPDGTPPDEYVTAPKYWQLPVKLAWALTIHRSQGQSLSEIVVDMGYRGATQPAMTYVALSRATDPWGVYFNTPLSPDDIIVDQRVKKFMTMNELVGT